MKRRWITAISCALLICMLVSTGLACSKKSEEGNVVVVIGDLSDFTGPGANALTPISWSLADYCSYVNQQGLLPGVTLSVASYDTKYDTSRFKLGYDSVRSQGATIIFTGAPFVAEPLKAQAATDKMPIVCSSATAALADDPGWVFCLANVDKYRVPVFLNWLYENDWKNTTSPAKIGLVGYNYPPVPDANSALKAYCQSHTSQFTLVDTTLLPYGTITFDSEVQKYKDCDYLFVGFVGATGYSTFISQYRTANGKAKFIGSDSFNAYVGPITQKVGWAAVDGSINYGNWGYWTTDSTEVDLIKTLLEQNHASEAATVEQAGAGAIAGAMGAHAAVMLLEAVIKEVGANNLTGQKVYDALQQVEVTPDGYFTVDFHDNERQGARYIVMERWSAAEQTLLMESDWVNCNP